MTPLTCYSPDFSFLMLWWHPWAPFSRGICSLRDLIQLAGFRCHRTTEHLYSLDFSLCHLTSEHAHPSVPFLSPLDWLKGVKDMTCQDQSSLLLLTHQKLFWINLRKYLIYPFLSQMYVGNIFPSSSLTHPSLPALSPLQTISHLLTSHAIYFLKTNMPPFHFHSPILI